MWQHKYKYEWERRRLVRLPSLVRALSIIQEVTMQLYEWLNCIRSIAYSCCRPITERKLTLWGGSFLRMLPGIGGHWLQEEAGQTWIVFFGVLEIKGSPDKRI